MMLLHFQYSTSGFVNNDTKSNILRYLAYTTGTMCQLIQLTFNWYEPDIFVLIIFFAIMQ
jgi:hypothetical protein